MMSTSPESREIRCPQCAAVNLQWDGKCWLCGNPLSGAESQATTTAVPQIAEVKPQFGLSTLLLVVTIVCICLGLVAIAPGLIVPLVAIVAPALVRSAVATRRYEGAASLSHKVSTFAVSLALVVLIWIAGLISLGVACAIIVAGGAALNFDENLLPFLIIISVFAVLASLGFMGWLFYLTLPGKRRK
jgi:hypothetical protein